MTTAGRVPPPGAAAWREAGVAATATPAAARSSLAWTARDIAAMTWRNIIRYVRIPQLLVFSTIQPVMFVLLFNYVFGGALRVPGVTRYIDYLMAGIFVQTAIFGSTQTGVGLAEDLSKGMIDRFRSLPMARSAVLAGRTLGDLFRNVFVVLLMTGVAYLVGFRFRGGVAGALAALALVLLVGFAFSWISATIGLLVRNVEAAQTAGFIWVFPLVFASSAFAPVQTMPGWLQGFARATPITTTVDAVRALSLGRPVGDALWWSLAWIAGILLVFVPFAVSRYRRIA
jgi:ABC-2 type transport system permease protein